MAAPPAPDWLLADSLPRGCLGAIIAPGGTGKGYMALQLSASLAAGAAWSPPTIISTSTGRGSQAA
ncbi:MAG: AAA family ATPase [Candidatus Adiutrix sp.]|nr:AAA family ATPase [Candidatus Adiutrix sp.]